MQSLARVSINGIGGPYDAPTVYSRIVAPVRSEQWRFDRLANTGIYLSDLTPFVDMASSVPQVDHDTTKDVKRTLQVTIRSDAPLSNLSDWIRVVYLLPMLDGGIVGFSQGVFTFQPNEDDIFTGITWRQLQMADPGQLLVDGTFLATYSVAAGTSYDQAIQALVASIKSPSPLTTNIFPPTGKTLPAALSWDIGVSRLKAINDLLQAVNYYSAWWDDFTLRSSPIPDFNSVTSTATMDCTQTGSPIRTPNRRKPDMTKVFNQALVKVEDPRRTPPVFGFYQNTDPGSPISVPNWHAKAITDTNSKLADKATAAARAMALVQEAARMYQPVETDTVAWPISQDHDIYKIIFSTPLEGLQVNNYVETRWTMNCAVGGLTTHEMQQITPC